MLLAMLVITAIALTCVLFATRQAMLGFPAAIFWALSGAQAYTQSTATWDIYYLTFFACMLGMTTFTMLGAYGLREKRDTIAEDEMDEGGRDEGGFIDEGNSSTESNSILEQGYRRPEYPPRRLPSRAESLHRRAKKRRERLKDGGGWGAFS